MFRSASSSWLDLVLTSMSSIDAKLLVSFHMGIGIGLILLTTILLFPGRPEQENDPDPQQQQQQDDTDTSSHSPPKDHDYTKTKRLDSKDILHRPSSATTDSHFRDDNDNDNNRVIDREGTSSSIGSGPVSDRQQQRQQQQHTRDGALPDIVWTPYQKLNAVVWIVILLAVYVCLDQAYHGAVTFWFRVYFPREAEILLGWYQQPHNNNNNNGNGWREQ